MQDIELVQGDCLEKMKNIPDGTIDMICCDLPYGVLNRNNKNAQWDNIIPFDKLWEQYKRIIKGNGAIVLTSQGMFTAELMLSNKPMWRYNLVWNKVLKCGFLNSNRQPLRQHEDIVVFSKGQTIYNPQMVKCEFHKRNHGKGKMNTPTNNCYGNFISLPTKISDEKFPTSIISIPKEHINGKSYHPTEKPVALLEYLIKTYTDVGMNVPDNCMGSGSTGIACINTNRKFIGIELNEKYFNIASKRIHDAINEKKQTLF